MRYAPGGKGIRLLASCASLTGVAVRRHIGAMDARHENRQRIERLTPLATVLRRIEECVLPVAPRRAAPPLDDLLGATLAADIVVPQPHPAAAVALIDGFAVRAEWTADAGSYAPAVLPHAADISAGDSLPGDCDAVMAPEAVTWRGGIAEAAVEVTAGDGVLMPGTDAGTGEVLRRAGELLRAADLAAMRVLGIESAIIRRPRIRLAHASGQTDPMAPAILAWLRHAVAADGGEPVSLADDGRRTTDDRPPGTNAPGQSNARPGAFAFDDLSSVLCPPSSAPAPAPADAVVIIGGTGSGTRDHAVQALAEAGSVEVHGIAMSPGESTAFGIASRPVLLVPGRLDGAIAAWLLVGRAMLARLAGGFDDGPACEQALTAKVVSTVGLAELVLVRRVRDGAEPLAAKYFPLASLAQADGFIVVPAASEGFPPGARVAVRPLP
jgi:molybdopterin molybdotransferase